MKLPLTIEITDPGQGHMCDSCRINDDTFQIDLLYRGDVIRRARLCHGCVYKGVEVDINLELSADPEKSKAAKRRVKDSRRLEKALADDLGGRPQPASGATRLAGYKGDVRKMGRWRVEHKFTDSLLKYNLFTRDIASICAHAADSGENPALVVEFRKLHESFTILPTSLFLELVDADNNHQRAERSNRRTGR